MTAPPPSRLPGTPGLLRTINDRAALELLLDSGPLTRSQIGDRTGVSRPTASQIVARLEQSGLIEPTGSVQGARGRSCKACTSARSSSLTATETNKKTS